MSLKIHALKYRDVLILLLIIAVAAMMRLGMYRREDAAGNPVASWIDIPLERANN